MNRQEYNNCVDKYADLLYRFILKATNDRQLSDDVVQDSFITLWEHVDHLDYNKAKSYLFTTAYRRMIDAFRRNKRDGTLDEVNYCTLKDNSMHFDLSEQLEIALQRLPDIQRHVVLLRDYEGYNYYEISEITGLNESQVKVYIFRARNTLRNFIKREEILI